MSTRVLSYGSRGRGATSTSTGKWDSTSSDLFDKAVSTSQTKKKAATSPAVRALWSKQSPGKKNVSQVSPASKVLYEYSNSPGTLISPAWRRESPSGMGESPVASAMTSSGGTKKKMKLTKKKEKGLKIFDFTSDEEEDSKGKKKKVATATAKKGKSVNRAKPKAGESSDGVQASDGECSESPRPKPKVTKVTKKPTPTQSKKGVSPRAKGVSPKVTSSKKSSNPSPQTSQKGTKRKCVSMETPPPKKTKVSPVKSKSTRPTKTAKSPLLDVAMDMESSQDTATVPSPVTDGTSPDAVLNVRRAPPISLNRAPICFISSRTRSRRAQGESDFESSQEVTSPEITDVQSSQGFSVVGEPSNEKPDEPDKMDVGFIATESEADSQPDEPDKMDVGFIATESEADSQPVDKTEPQVKSPPTTDTQPLETSEKQDDERPLISETTDVGGGSKTDTENSQLETGTDLQELQKDSKSDSHDLEPGDDRMEECDSGNVEDKSHVEACDLSLSEPADEPVFTREFNRHLQDKVPPMKKSSSSTPSPTATSSSSPSHLKVPSLSRSSTWPKCSSKNGEGGVKCKREEKELITVVRNVKQAHECLEMGESQQFFDEMEYLLDSIKQDEPLPVRCLGACNLASHCLDSEFAQQIRAHGFTNKIIMRIKDCLEHPCMCVSAAVLLYVMTRDKLNSDWNKNGVDLLIGMLSMEGLGSDLTGKAAKDLEKTMAKARSVLQKTNEALSVKDEGGEKGEGHSSKHSHEHHFSVNTENISVSELSRESLYSLTSPLHNPHWLREELRISGALDHLANMAITGSKELVSLRKDVPSPVEGEGRGCEGVERRLRTLERVLKCLENVTLMNKDNQSYLIVFDGSVLISELTILLTTCDKLIGNSELRPAALDCLLSVIRVLINLTHDNELGSHRVGEQKGGMEAIVGTVFQLPDELTEENRFDVLVLALGLLINLIEHSARNRNHLETIVVQYPSNQDSQTTAKDSDDVAQMEADMASLHSNKPCLRALIQLFLKHYSKAEEASIDVPTPQRLSQLTSSPHASPLRPSHSKRDLTPSFSAKMRLQHSHRTSRKSVKSSQDSQKSDGDDGTGWMSGSQDSEKPTEGQEQTENENEEEEEYESLQMDPLVFSREEFDAALTQAGKHMEDSIVASYTALLLGILAKHNQDSVDVIRGGMPSQAFSEMIGVLKKFVSFMNITGSASGTQGLDSIRHIIKYLEAL